MSRVCVLGLEETRGKEEGTFHQNHKIIKSNIIIRHISLAVVF